MVGFLVLYIKIIAHDYYHIHTKEHISLILKVS